MPDQRPCQPKYRHHKARHLAVVRVDGRDIYVGKYDSPESQEKYDRVIAEWLSHGRRLPTDSDLSVNELMLGYMRHAERYYRKNGQPTATIYGIRAALRPLKRLFGSTPAASFGPRSFKLVRQAMIDAGHSRTYTNDNCKRIRQMFKWGVENELVPPSVHHGLQAVGGLKRGRTEARETEPVGPVAEAVVRETQRHLPRQVAAMIDVQLLSSMRPGEVCIMRASDIEMTGDVWIYRPSSHKTEHHGRLREIPLGPRAQGVIRPFLSVNREKYLFSPAEAEAERNADRRECRKSPMTPSQARRQPKRNRRRPPRDHYTTDSYRRAIHRACVRAFETDDAGEAVLTWHPNQLRHTGATEIRKRYGIEAARVVLGHANVATSEIYAERDSALARKIALNVG